MERRPRAPVLRSTAFWQPPAAKGRISSSTPSIENSFWYCLTSAFFGSIRISTSASIDSSSSVATTGRRPISSGIRPNLIGIFRLDHAEHFADGLLVVLALDLGAEADAALLGAVADDLSRPSKARRR